VLELLEKAARNEAGLFASFASLAECKYITEADFGAQKAQRAIADLKQMPITWVHSDDALCINAADIKLTHRVSFADAFVAATAVRVEAVLAHKDPEILKIPTPLKQEMLPPKVASVPS